jgi:hypothetical protein
MRGGSRWTMGTLGTRYLGRRWEGCVHTTRYGVFVFAAGEEKSRRRVLDLLKAPSLRDNVAALGGRSRCVCRKLTRGLAYEYKRCPLLILVLLLTILLTRFHSPQPPALHALRITHPAPRTMSAQPPETPTKAGAATGAATGAAWSDAEKIAYMLVVAEHALDAALESKVSVRQMHST